MIRRVFIAHPKQLDDATLIDFVERARRALLAAPAKEPLELEITTGRQTVAEWEKARLGLPFDWGGWTNHVTGSTKPWGGEPRFHYFVVGPEYRVLGRATAGLLVLALRYGRTVLALEGERLVKITAVVATNPNSWKDGYTAIVG